MNDFSSLARKYFSDTSYKFPTKEELREFEKRMTHHLDSPGMRPANIRAMTPKELKRWKEQELAAMRARAQKAHDKKWTNDVITAIDIALTLIMLYDIALLGVKLIQSGYLGPKAVNILKTCLPKASNASIPGTIGKRIWDLVNPVAPKDLMTDLMLHRNITSKSMEIVTKAGEYIAKRSLTKAAASKSASIVIREVKAGEEILSSSKQVAKTGDIIVANVINKTPDWSHAWVTRKSLLPRDYRRVGSVFKPVEAPMEFYQIPEDIKYIAPWKEEFILREGDFLMKNPETNQIFGVTKLAFDKGYTIIE